ncbi:DNA-processing protein DprA [uncultured Cellulomonas sp.]|uniref:DNA-processing protein DprA n=1 Tax=uncultured Cellulomonas sp. TaxID=189682 RepID=UPI00261EB7EC|nr:DNA-processing protein DprA [uncultured Cellulomonas sp.]
MSAAPAAASWLHDERCARAAWSRLAEPGDTAAGTLIGLLGAGDALAWVADVVADGVAGNGVAGNGVAGGGGTRAAAHGRAPYPGAATAVPDLPGRHLAPLASRCGPLDAAARRRLAAAVVRWAVRWPGLDPRRDLDALDALGGTLLHPGVPAWPTGVDDLGPAAPPCLWVRGNGQLGSLVHRSVALVGARASTAYGDHVATELAVGLADRRFTVVSGGAYGIDAAAHRGSVVARAPTVVLLAGGVDRPYPAGNAGLLRAVVGAGGAVVSEVPPGSVPSRTRFLLRNRLIAAASRATVVVEAAWRSGALSTAGHAVTMLRPVGAVPGPVTSMASAGCHRLLRDGSAVCVTDAAEVAELAGELGADLAPPRPGPSADVDGLGAEARRVLDALPVTRPAPVASVARAAGLGEHDVRGALGLLELEGLATREAGGWRRVRRAAGGGP